MTKLVCPECYKKIHKLGDKNLYRCMLTPVNIEGLKEVGQCPTCKKYWTEEGYEVKITYKIEEGITNEFNPSKRTKRD